MSSIEPEWATAIGTMALAFAAVFQDQIKAWWSRPLLDVSSRASNPDCMLVPTVTGNGVIGRRAEAIYVRLWIHNAGNAPALHVEAFVSALRRRSNDHWDAVKTFAPMNLRWSDIHAAYFPRIAPGMGKHCDLAEIMKPADIKGLNSLPPALDVDETAIRLLTIVQPFHQGNVIGPGRYALDLIVAAENAKPLTRTLEFELTGEWYSDESEMLRRGLTLDMQ